MEKRNWGYIVKSITAVLFGIIVLSGCGNLNSEKGENPISYSETQNGVAEDGDGEEEEGGDIGEDIEESADEDIREEAEESIEDNAGDGVVKDTEEGLEIHEQEPEYQQEIPIDTGRVMEIYNGKDAISVIEDILIAQVLPEEVLKGNPVIYDRLRVDGWVFEWLISDYQDDDNHFLEDGVLVVSREGDSETAQVITVKAEGGYATWVSVEHKFEYIDVNFDGLSDLLICTGHHGNQGALTYYCFLQTNSGFVEEPSFTDISNPGIDEENKLILSQWRNTAASHSWAEFKCQNNTYIMYRELREDWKMGDSGEDIWVWTVNGETIGRSDELSMEEIYDLLYSENSEWGILGDRWRTLYNNGLTADYSIYDEP